MKHVLLSILFLTGLCAQSQPTIEADGPLEFCSGESVTLCVEPEYTSYLWCTGSTTQCITITESGDYCVILLDAQGNLDSTFVDSVITVIVYDPEPMVTQFGDTLVVVNGPFESYQWTINNQPIQGANESFYVATAPGNYNVMVTDTNGCEGMAFMIDGDPWGIDEQEYHFQIFPNPTTDILRINLSSLPQSDFQISVTNILGCSISHLQTESTNVDLNISNWPNGIYLITISTPQVQSSSRFIKTNAQ